MSPQTILVTGSNGGFGRRIVETLGRQRYTVIAGMREPEAKNAAAAAELRTLAQRANFALHVVALDVTDDDSVTQAVAQTMKVAGRIDVVINNAGVSYSGPLEAFTIEQVKQQFDTNVYSVLRINNAVLPIMRAQQSGLLMQIGSIVGRIGFPFLGLYGATKFALEGLTESYRYELAALGIDSVIVEPGTFPTNISVNRKVADKQEHTAPYAPVMNAYMPAFFAENRSATPPDPQDVADAIATLIATPAGDRPLRTIVAAASQREAPQQINDVAVTATNSYLDSLGILPLLTLAKKQQP